MPQSSLRRTKIPNEGRSRNLLTELSTDALSVESLEERTVDVLCEGYPFEGQTVYTGRLRYEEEGMWDTGRTIPLTFELRDQSNLFVLKSDVDFSIEVLIEKINQAFEDDIRIYRNLTVNRERLWNFFRSADKVLDISVLSDTGEERSFDEFEGISQAEVIGQYPIEGASVAYQYENQQIIVRYANGSITVQSDWPEATEYIVQIFERDVLNHRNGG